MDPSDWDGFAEDHYEDRQYAREEMQSINALSDGDFLDYVLKSDRKLLNGVVLSFPAYDIAERIKQQDWQPTAKQRHAITNVYLFMKYGWKQENLR